MNQPPTSEDSSQNNSSSNSQPATNSIISSFRVLNTEREKPKNESETKRIVKVVKLLIESAKTQEALDLIEQSISSLHFHKDLFLLKAQCLFNLQKNSEALNWFVKILEHDSKDVDGLIGTAAVHHSKGENIIAMKSLQFAREIQPNNKEITEALAVVLTDTGTQLAARDAKGSVEKYMEAVELCPYYPHAHYNLGVYHGTTPKALDYYKKAVELDPNLPMAWTNIGVIHSENNDFLGAIDAYTKAIAVCPTHQLIHSNMALAIVGLGNQARQEGKNDIAVQCYQEALLHQPSCIEALYNLGATISETGSLKQAAFLYETAISYNPNIPEIHNNLGAVYIELGNEAKALECYYKAVSIQPTFIMSLCNIGVIYTMQGKIKDGMEKFQAALSINPSHIEAHNNLGILQKDIGLTKESLLSYERCLQIDPKCRNPGHNFLLGLNYLIPGESPQVSDYHLSWGELMNSMFPQLSPITSSNWNTQEDRALKVGYISPDLFCHSVSYFAEAPLSHHRPNIIHLTVYNCTASSDQKTELLKKKVQESRGIWKDVKHLQEKELAALIRKDEIDILVELSGHTAHNRLGTISMKPAPIQATWIGYPNTTGLKQVDYRLTDVHCDPEDTTQVFSETLLRIPGCFLCYTPVQNPPEVAPAPCLENGFITFGSFNNLAKITPDVIQVWSEILKRVPHARLIMKNKTFACEITRQYFTEQFEKAGVKTHQIDLIPLFHKTEDHLSVYSRMDISLDPWPYAGTTTTCESLFMGVPCLTLAGRCHAQNVGVSLIRAVGLSESWIAHSSSEYIHQAIEKASDFRSLAEARKNLRSQMLKSDLCDVKKHIMRLESVYQSMWRTWLKQ